MEKRTMGTGKSERGARRLGLVCLGVSLGGCLALGLALASLELARREEMVEIRARLEVFALETTELRIALENVTKQLTALEQQAQQDSSRDLGSKTSKSKKGTEYYDDYYEDDSYYDEDAEEDGEEEPRPSGGGGGGNSNSNSSSRRGRRSVQYSNRYQVRIAKGQKTHFHNPSAVQARIYVEKSDPRIYQELVRPEDRFVQRKDGERMREGDKLPKAIHFGGDTSHFHHYSSHPHNYRGGHKMYPVNRVFKNWKPSHWVDGNSDFTMDNMSGELTVMSPGLYYVYAQIFYEDRPDESGFRIIRNNVTEFQCTVTSFTPFTHSSVNKIVKKNSCYTGGLLRLHKDDTLWIKEVEGNRFVLYEKTKSFFGMFRVAAK